MRVLLLGGGGREHALGWKLSQSTRVRSLVSVPGNPGLAELGETIPEASPSDPHEVARLAEERDVDLVVIGPEAPLATGVVDELESRRIPVWGPVRAAASLETSKAFSKKIMDRAGVATARWESFTETSPALVYLRTRHPPLVVKANGLAAGKGVLVTDNLAEAETWIRRCLSGDFGEARVVIEDFLAGPELSVFALCSGEDAIPLAPARDFKRLGDGDQGPNTGGMGSFSPVADLPPGILEHTIEKVIRPVLATMADDGIPYKGFLYAGLVLTADGPQVLEFNCRLGDPETQVVLPRLESDLVDLIEAGLGGRLQQASTMWSEQACVNVVLAAPGYPENPRRGDRIRIGPLPPSTMVFHAGTGRDGEGLFATGGRVLNVVGTGSDLAAARRAAYEGVAAIDFPGAVYRRDI